MSKFRVRPELVVAPVGDELLVFDPKAQAAHNLSAEAAALFSTLNRGDLPEETDDNLAILAQFAEKGFLEDSQEWSRRDLMVSAVKAAAIPLIASVALPLPAAAQSGVSEADCELSGGAACGQPCTGFPIGTRVCGSITGTPGGACGCVPTPAACACI